MASRLRFILALSLLASSGCAGTVSSVFNRPVTAHDLSANRLMTVTGERRLAFIAPLNPTVRMCAESLPEVSSAVAAASGANLSAADHASGGFNDSFRTALLQTFARTEIAEVLRQMGWQACQAWAQGAISNEQYQQELARIIGAGIDVVKIRATQPLPVMTTRILPFAPDGITGGQNAATPDDSAGESDDSDETGQTGRTGQASPTGPTGPTQCPAGSPQGATPPNCSQQRP